jgi:hypothetical protein
MRRGAISVCDPDRVLVVRSAPRRSGRWLKRERVSERVGADVLAVRASQVKQKPTTLAEDMIVLRLGCGDVLLAAC